MKYLQRSLVFAPIALPILLWFLSRKFPFVLYIELAIIAIGIAWFIYQYFKITKLFRTISEGSYLPSAVEDFPICETSEAEYRTTRKKMETFILAIERGERIQVKLTAAEINSLATKGITPSRTEFADKLRLPGYYSIVGSQMFVSSITFAPFVSKTGIKTFVHTISLSKEDGKLIETQRLVKENEKSISTKHPGINLSGSTFLSTVLQLDKTLEWVDSMQTVIEKLESIEVLENEVTLRA